MLTENCPPVLSVWRSSGGGIGGGGTGTGGNNSITGLGSGGSGGVVWRIRCHNTKLVCAVGSRNGTEETKLLVLDFDLADDNVLSGGGGIVSGAFTESAC